MDKRTSIREKLMEILVRKGDDGAFSDGDSLLLSGRLDSLNVLELVSFLEDAFAVDMADLGMEVEAFDSVDSLVEVVGE